MCKNGNKYLHKWTSLKIDTFSNLSLKQECLEKDCYPERYYSRQDTEMVSTKTWWFFATPVSRST